MKRAIHVTLGCLLAAALSQSTVHAQPLRTGNNFGNNFRTQAQGMVNSYNSMLGARNPYYTYSNQLQLMQAPFAQGSLYTGSWGSQALMNNLGARTYGTDYGIPFNYSTVANYYSPYNYGYGYGGVNPYVYGGGVNPYAYGGGGFGYGGGLGYGGGFGGGFANPYSPGAAVAGAIDSSNPYSPYGNNPYNPYNPFNPYTSQFNTTGASLMGAADVNLSYGKVINDQEDARIKREKALQEQQNTRRLKFDTDNYIKANTPTYTQEQEVAARNKLRRIQTNSLPGEVQNGGALNYLLKDLSKYPVNKNKVPFEPASLSESVLSRISVTKGNYGLGLLRDDGRFTWPSALQGLLGENQRKEIEDQVKSIVKDAYKGKLDANALKDVRNEMSKLTDDLLKKVNEIPSNQYMAAKRFLNDFDHATDALDRGEAPVQEKYQRFIAGGRTVQEVTNYMVENGLKFAPATADDEAAYRAIHAALANYDIAINVLFGGGDAKDQ